MSDPIDAIVMELALKSFSIIVEDLLLSTGWSDTAARAVKKIASVIVAGKRLRRAALPI